MDEEAFETLVDASRVYQEDIFVNGDFRYDGQSVAARSGPESFNIYLAVDKDPVEALDTVNAYFPIEGNLEVLSGDRSYDPENFSELEGHAYHAYSTDDWKVVTDQQEDFGFFWNHERADRLSGGEHTVSVFANSEDHDYGPRSVEPLKYVVPELAENLEEPVVSDLQAFAMMDPGDFELTE